MTLIALGHPIHYIILGESTQAKARAEIIQAGVKLDEGVSLELYELESLGAIDPAVLPFIIWVVATADGPSSVSEEVARRVVGPRRAVFLSPDEWALPVMVG